MGDFANYWQAFVPHTLRFGYHFVNVYYHLKEHYVNFFRFFLGFLNYFIYLSNYWVFKNAYFQSFFVRIMDLKKNVKTYLYVKKSQLYEKNTIFSIAMQESTQNRRLTLKVCFWGSSATSILNFIFFFKSWDFFT